MRTSRARNTSWGSYHSRSQWVWGMIHMAVGASAAPALLSPVASVALTGALPQ